ncbi:ABC transporter substrate-binding protein [Oleiharenicola lentus]|uniref:ABC transporter substrate-binding protein n=1 Tax=Oleiharenicola lentus TaxID=2508720 RepID=UPI003F67F11D
MPVRSSPQFLQRALVAAAIAATALFNFSTPLVAQDTIKIGEFASLTGKEAVFGQNAHKGTLLAIEEANAAGGVLGRKLELITEDDQSKPGESATVVKKMISRDKVIAVLGEITSGRTLEAAPICQNAKIPLISPGATATEVTKKGNYIFRVCFIDEFQGTVMAKFASETLKLKRMAVLSSVSSPQSVGLAKYFKERFTSDGGTVALEQKYSEGEKDFRAQLTAIKAASVEGIFIPGYYAEAALIAKQSRELGLKVALLGIDGWESPELIQIGGAAVEGSYLSTHYSPESKAAGVSGFNERYRKRWGIDTNALSALGYDSAMVLIDAIKRAGTTEGPKLRDAIAATKNFSGATGSISFDAQRNPTKSAVVLTVKDGRYAFLQDVNP